MSSRARAASTWTALVVPCVLAPWLALAQDAGGVAAPAQVQSPAAPGPVPTQSPGVELPVVAPPVSAPPAPASPVVAPSVSAPPPPAPAGTATQPVPAPAPPAPADEHRHLGLFFHADVGGAYLRTSGSRGGSSFASEGGALGVGLAVGWAPDDAWAIALEIWSWKALSPSGLGKETSVELQALGLNVTRYIVPVDIFASVVVSGTRLAITDSAEYVEYASSDIGFGFKVLLGKEWRLSSWLGLGVAAELFVSVNRDGGETLRTVGGGLVLSCTGR